MIVFAVVVGLMSLTAFVLVLSSEVDKKLEHEKIVFDGRLKSAQLYFSATSTIVSSAAGQIESSIEQADGKFLDLPLEMVLVPRGNTGMFAVHPEDPSGFWGCFPDDGVSGDLKTEISGVLSLDGLMSGITGVGGEFVWVYYLSAKRFLYIDPPLQLEAPEEFEEFYRRPFWTELLPVVNPRGSLRVTSVYEDYGGMGAMVTVCKPVVWKNRFRGVFCADIVLKELHAVVSIGDSMGVTAIIDENFRFVTTSKSSDRDEIHGAAVLHGDLDNSEFMRIDGDFVVTGQIFPGQLKAVHKVDASVVLLQSLIEEIPVLIALIVFNSLVVLSLHLKKTLTRETEESDFSRKLISIVGHDLQTPLSVIKQAADLIDEQEDSSALNLIRSSTESAIYLLKDLSYWGKSRFQNIFVQKTLCSVASVVNKAVDAVGSASDLKEIRVKTVVQVNTVLVDADILSTVLRNILSNAIKFSPRLGVVVLEVVPAADRKAEFRISDSGMGMSEQQVQLFQRGETLEKRRGSCDEKGSGIGLGIVASLCSRAGWPISVESRVGEGTRFVISVPVE